jgi:hypothetical protein
VKGSEDAMETRLGGGAEVDSSKARKKRMIQQNEENRKKITHRRVH